jgi:UDP-GlcNAc3NAcA epimerase
MKIISLVGTRPQFLKLAPLSKQFIQNKINHKIIHSGQHYDKEMSDDLFKTLEINEPDYLLKKNGNTQIEFLSNMMINIEKILLDEMPDKLIVFGDCDTTIAGALVAKKLKIYLIHIEAGMRSYNMDMPEEINRVLTDHISDLLLCSTIDSIKNLEKENIKKNIFFVGNLQLDLISYCCQTYNNKGILYTNNIETNNFVLLTIHREYNTNCKTLTYIMDELKKLNSFIIFPIHPRTMNIINEFNIKIPDNLKLIKPVNYLDMTILERNCKYIITDSGGIQPEAWFLKKKCIIMRSETEWIEPLENNNNILYDYETPLNEFIKNFLEINIKNVEISTNASINIIDKILNK